MAKRKQQVTKRSSPLIVIILIIALLFGGYFYENYINEPVPISLSDIPEFSGVAYIEINGGVPFFDEEEITTLSYESYSPLDALGRCGVAIACIGIDIMPTEERGDIDNIKPTGWIQAQYDSVPGRYLYDRCHLIGFQLTGENDNERNLITGTGYMNVEGMLPFENDVAEYIERTENHVMYRVTPIFKSYDLVARGVLIEAYSVEDNGKGLQFCVYCYNNQPGVIINYFDGSSYLEGEAPPPSNEGGEGGEGGTPSGDEITYVLNTSKSSMKIHLPDCRYAIDMKEENRKETTKSLSELISDGYSPCGVCKPE